MTGPKQVVSLPPSPAPREGRCVLPKWGSGLCPIPSGRRPSHGHGPAQGSRGWGGRPVGAAGRALLVNFWGGVCTIASTGFGDNELRQCWGALHYSGASPPPPCTPRALTPSGRDSFGRAHSFGHTILNNLHCGTRCGLVVALGGFPPTGRNSLLLGGGGGCPSTEALK